MPWSARAWRRTVRSRRLVPLLARPRDGLLRRQGRPDEARAAYDGALTLGGNGAERTFLSRRRDGLSID